MLHILNLIRVLLFHAMSHLFPRAILKHPTDVAARACHVRPVDASLHPVKVKGNSIVEIFGNQVDHAAIQCHVADVVAIGEKQNRLFYCKQCNTNVLFYFHLFYLSLFYVFVYCRPFLLILCKYIIACCMNVVNYM